MISASLKVICGSMFSGKSEELIRRIRRCEYANKKVLILTPKIDKRYGENGIYSHNKNSVKSNSISTMQDIEEVYLKNIDCDVVAIDEVQFFPNGIVDFIKRCVKDKKLVIVAGLDMDFKGEPFSPIGDLLAIADDIYKLKAICTVCGEDAYLSQRIINGKPAKPNEPLIQVGANETYEARCRKHHTI